MQIIPLQQLVNQALSVTLENSKYDLSFRTIGDLTYATISKDSVKLVDGVRCVPFRPLLHPYQENGGGNFSFYTQNDEYPMYTGFGTRYVLLYATAAELASLRAAGG
jgi:hypothetical protein